MVRAGPGNKKGKKIVRAAYGKKMEFLTRPHPLTNFEIKAYYQNGPKFNGTYSRSNLPKNIKYEAYIINLDEYADVSTHWIALFCNRSETVYFDSLVLNMFLKKLNNLSGIKT